MLCSENSKKVHVLILQIGKYLEMSAFVTEVYAASSKEEIHSYNIYYINIARSMKIRKFSSIKVLDEPFRVSAAALNQ